jgi:hypothetical protein
VIVTKLKGRNGTMATFHDVMMEYRKQMQMGTIKLFEEIEHFLIV